VLFGQAYALSSAAVLQKLRDFLLKQVSICCECQYFGAARRYTVGPQVVF
jgi:hypothetical protein